MQIELEFMQLFSGYTRKSGRTQILPTDLPDPVTRKIKGKSWTVDTGPTVHAWRSHLDGKLGIGVIPLNQEGTTNFGCIDIDVYPLDYKAVLDRIRELGLPLCMVRSKSGGVHLFLFMTEQTSAPLITATLRNWAGALGHGNREVYPLQERILDGGTDSAQWLNMPYYNVADCQRKGMDEAGMEFDEPGAWVQYASGKRVTEEWLRSLHIVAPDLLKGAPPCLNQLCKAGFPSGSRNKGLFNLAVYARKSAGDSWTRFVEDYNVRYLHPPLPSEEVLGVIRSANKKDYFYTCNDDPIRSYCDKKACRQCEFGIGKGKDKQLPDLAALTRFKTDPPIWYLDVQGQRISMLSESLQSPSKFQLACLNKGIHVPLLDRKEWDAIRGKLLERVIDIEAPEDASAEGQLKEALTDWLTTDARTDLMDDMILGRPVRLPDTMHSFGFKLSDFMAELHRRRITTIARNTVASFFATWGFSKERKRFNYHNVEYYEARLDFTPSALATPEVTESDEDPY